MNSRPDPKKAIHIKPQRRTLKREQKRPLSRNPWQPHRGEAALDAWGIAIHILRAQGVAWE